MLKLIDVKGNPVELDIKSEGVCSILTELVDGYKGELTAIGDMLIDAGYKMVDVEGSVADFVKYNLGNALRDIEPVPAPVPNAYSKFEGKLCFDKTSCKYGYLSGYHLDDGAAGYLAVCDHEDLTGEHILVDVSTLTLVDSVPAPAPIPASCIKVLGRDYYSYPASTEKPYTPVYTHHIVQRIVDELTTQKVPRPEGLSPAPLLLKDGNSVHAEWINGEWYYKCAGVNAKLTILANQTQAIPPAAAPVAPTIPVTLTNEANHSYYGYLNAGWTDKQLVDAGYAFWNCPQIPEPEQVTSITINGEQWFKAEDALRCFSAWENSDEPLYKSLNKLRAVIGATGRGYVSTVDLAIKNHEQFLSTNDDLAMLRNHNRVITKAIAVARKVFNIDKAVNDAGVIHALHNRLAEVDECVEQFNDGFESHLKHYTPNKVTGVLNQWFYPLDETDSLIRKLVRQLRKVNKERDNLRDAKIHIKSLLEAAREEFGIDDMVGDADTIDLLHRRLKSAEFCAAEVSEHLDLKPGTVICGDKAVIESLADQWSKVYKLVHGSAGGNVDNATEAAHNFIEIIK